MICRKLKLLKAKKSLTPLSTECKYCPSSYFDVKCRSSGDMSLQQLITHSVETQLGITQMTVSQSLTIWPYIEKIGDQPILWKLHGLHTHMTAPPIM